MERRSRPTGVQSLPASPTRTDARRWSRLTGFQSPSRRRRRATHSIVSPAVDRMEHLVEGSVVQGTVGPIQKPKARGVDPKVKNWRCRGVNPFWVDFSLKGWQVYIKGMQMLSNRNQIIKRAESVFVCGFGVKKNYSEIHFVYPSGLITT
ncbi:glycine--tRNA ligase alpha subunit [Striga asiatica]|uniref:Glycine--tRNA ligase alpha subunit n=1 Tax=Striga asiatica TaxID=4170 RepID=A0A5A7QWB2_STRAF|nr:glycine--tRNA ligase alpha subunit [Striga asiatica]